MHQMLRHAVAVAFDHNHAGAHMRAADKIGKRRVRRAEPIDAIDHQRIKIAFSHEAGEVGFHWGESVNEEGA